MIIFDHGSRKIASASCTGIENIEIGILAAVVNKFVGNDKVYTARSSAAIGGVCPRKLKEMIVVFTAITIAFINTHILVVLNRAAAFTVRYIGSISFCTTANMKILHRKKLLYVTISRSFPLRMEKPSISSSLLQCSKLTAIILLLRSRFRPFHFK